MIETSGELLYFDGYKYLNARPWSVKTPFVGMPCMAPAHDGGAPWVRLDIDGWMHFRAGYAWDGPSGPTWDTPNSLRGSQAHDGPYQLSRLSLLPDRSEAMRERVDRFLYAMLRQDGMSWVRARLWLRGVRVGAAYAWAPQPEIVKCAPSGRKIRVPHGQTLEQILAARPELAA